uniref:G-protein coupled receptors family 1 profile domain-containing protein n=1 Tax=Odontella aurita TaxID=265563 RepID=A0A7S4MG28_9STRA
MTNATRYDWAHAAPSDALMRSTWITWAVIASLVATACLTLIAGLLLSRRARRKPFNLYLAFLTVPDALFSGMCAMTCSMSAAAGRYYSSAMCEWQSWYVMFGFTANMWMNLVVARHLHDMLRTLQAGRRYDPPTCCRVCVEATVVYTYASVLSSLTLLPEKMPWSPPIREDAIGGVACVPVEYSLVSTLFFWLIFVPLMIGIPIVYIGWVCHDVHKYGMLPSSGRSRFLALYFLRLVFVFVGMWLPVVILIFGVAMKNYWLSFVGGTWSHLQGFVSVGVSLTKPDVKRAVLSFVTCRSCSEDDDMRQRQSNDITTDRMDHSMARRSSGGESLRIVRLTSSSLQGSQVQDDKQDDDDGKRQCEEMYQDHEHDVHEDPVQIFDEGRQQSEERFHDNEIDMRDPINTFE